MTTYLQAVNDVLVRLREEQVSTVTETSYSSLIGKFVNDAKRQIEDSYEWNILGTTVVVSTVAGTSSYSLTGTGQKFRVQDVINDTNNTAMTNIPFVNMNRYLNFGTVSSGVPLYYCFDGVDGSYDTKVTVFPIPDSVVSLRFSLIVPQAPLTADATVILMPSELIVQSAYARALVERGEDGGLSSSEAYQLYRAMLSDYISMEATRYPEFGSFEAV
jgi:hypothetical protein